MDKRSEVSICKFLAILVINMLGIMFDVDESYLYIIQRSRIILTGILLLEYGLS